MGNSSPSECKLSECQNVRCQRYLSDRHEHLDDLECLNYQWCQSYKKTFLSRKRFLTNPAVRFRSVCDQQSFSAFLWILHQDIRMEYSINEPSFNIVREFERPANDISRHSRGEEILCDIFQLFLDFLMILSNKEISQ